MEKEEVEDFLEKIKLKNPTHIKEGDNPFMCNKIRSETVVTGEKGFITYVDVYVGDMNIGHPIGSTQVTKEACEEKDVQNGTVIVRTIV